MRDSLQTPLSTLGTRGHVSMMATCCVSTAIHSPGCSLPTHEHPHSTVTVVVAGGYAEHMCGTQKDVAPLGVIVKPAGTKHANRFGRHGALSLVIESIGDSFQSFDRYDGHGAGDDTLDVPRVLDGMSSGSATIRLVNEMKYGRATPGVIEVLVADLFACLTMDVERTKMRAPRWLLDVRDRIHDVVRDLTAVELASESGYHPVYVARCFKRYFGTSIGAYAAELRLSRAARMLATKDAAVSRVAMDAGYYDHSHMTHDFRSRTGSTPTAWRRTAAP